MSAHLPEPRFTIGQTVWKAEHSTRTEMLPCPDCLGTRTWKLTSPAGFTSTLTCPRCNPHISLNKVPGLRYEVHEPATRQLTIGSITASTHARGHESPVQYMCEETGIGSGSVYDEARLHATQEEAHAEAVRLVAGYNARVREQPAVIQMFKFESWLWDDAHNKALQDRMLYSYGLRNRYYEMLEAIVEPKKGEEFGGIKAVQEYIRDELAFTHSYVEDRTDLLDRLERSLRTIVHPSDTVREVLAVMDDLKMRRREAPAVADETPPVESAP